MSTNATMHQNQPVIDTHEYPFRSHGIELGTGRMHYVDEGSGPVIVMVHGTPTWSFLYRHLIKRLAKHYRVIAPDNIGFGLSDKPERWTYRPQDHAKNLETLITRLDLRDITLMVHDFGGPIGLSYAIHHPENVRRLVLFNTWMWSLKGNSAIEKGSRIFGGSFGKFLYTRLNFSPKFLLKSFYGDKGKLTPEIHRHYTDVFPTPASRMSTWICAKELIGSSDWFQGLWERREAIRNIPALLLWGMKDPSFKEDALRRWKSLFENCTATTFPNAGHFVQEEAYEEAGIAIEEFLRREKYISV